MLGNIPNGPWDEQLTSRINEEDCEGNQGEEDATVDQMMSNWNDKSRSTFTDMLGKDVSSNGRAEFKWRPASYKDASRSAQISKQAAAWSSAANNLSTLTSRHRKARTYPSSAELAEVYDGAHRMLLDEYEELQDDDSRLARVSWLSSVNDLHQAAAALPGIAHEDMARTAARALRQAQALDKRLAAAAKAEFKAWITEGGGYRGKCLPLLPGRNAFRFLKHSHGWAPPAHGAASCNLHQRSSAHQDGQDECDVDQYEPMENDEVLLNEQGEVEMIADKWASLWKEHGASFQPPAGDLGDALRPLTANDIREVARSFPVSTCLGADNIAPRALLMLPEARLHELARLLNKCEEQGRWPEACELVLIVLLPKPDGGRRPIGLFPTTIRVWMRARAQSLREWEARNQHPGLFGSKGMSATRASWAAAVRAEVAGKDG